MLCLRDKSAHFAPGSCSTKMPMIYSSMNRVRLIVRPQVGAASNRWLEKNSRGRSMPRFPPKQNHSRIHPDSAQRPRSHSRRRAKGSRQADMPRACAGRILSEAAGGHRELGTGNWELGTGNWELGENCHLAKPQGEE